MSPEVPPRFLRANGTRMRSRESAAHHMHRGTSSRTALPFPSDDEVAETHLFILLVKGVDRRPHLLAHHATPDTLPSPPPQNFDS